MSEATIAPDKIKAEPAQGLPPGSYEVTVPRCRPVTLRFEVGEVPADAAIAFVSNQQRIFVPGAITADGAIEVDFGAELSVTLGERGSNFRLCWRSPDGPMQSRAVILKVRD